MPNSGLYDVAAMDPDSAALRWFAGLNPQPPLLYKTVPHSSPAELFWTVKNGIKMTDMPAPGA